MSVKTIKVSNVSNRASEQDIREFFAFSGEIEYVELMSGNEESQVAFVTFKDSKGADTASLLTGATIIDKTVSISSAPDYELPPAALAQISESENQQSALEKAEDVVSTMLAKGFTLGKDAVGKAKSFDEKHKLTSTASLKISSFDRKIGLTRNISMGTSAVNSKVKEMDQKFQVSEKTKSAFSIAEEKVSSTGSVIMKNSYVLMGVTWVMGVFNKVTKAASDVGQKTKEKVGKVEDEQRRKALDDYAMVYLSETPKTDSHKALSSPSFSSPEDSPPPYSEIEQEPAKPDPEHKV